MSSHPTDPNKGQKWKEDVIEAVIATYPEDIFPEPEYKPKNNEVSWVMRQMAGAIASITAQLLDALLSKIEEEIEGKKVEVDTLAFNRFYQSGGNAPIMEFQHQGKNDGLSIAQEVIRKYKQ